ncbi:glycosyl transferase [Ancylobacter sp. A5.8]|uniref:ArnT family glycosyltransferase n=1 Tax=Ancylobacter gelatini TaxID=2919920 RepID=UPI001F4EA501|nr:glycosyl transferase [Ancylobacter gelatini]MCJ8143209.1 glycosyl transferase [Ancylobacter gelatini]
MISRTGTHKKPGSPLAAPGRLRAAERILALFDACSRSNLRACLFLVGLSLIAFLPGLFAIPVVDRDEARTAQISRQMVEGGSLTDTRIGVEARHTRPFGFYWLQAGVVALGEVVAGEGAVHTIALYRLPSLAAGIGAVLLTFWAALAFVRRRAALLAATLLASSAAIGIAARLAVPDAVLVAAVAAMMGAFARVYVGRGGENVGRPPLPAAIDVKLAAIFWGGLCAALMAKGVLAPLYVAVPLVALAAADRSVRLLRPLAPFHGLAVCLLLVANWFVLRHWTGTESAAETAERLLIGRVAPFFPGFTALPGAYLLMFWGLFWPAAPLAALTLPILWKARRLRSVRCLLAWVLPVWLVLEFYPTKIPGFVLPTFPAIAILIALAVERGALALANTRLVRLLWLWPVIGALIAVLALLGLAIFDRTTSVLSWPLLLLGFFALVIAAGSVRDYGVEKATLLAVAGMLVSGFGVMQLIVPNLQSIWVSPRLAEAASAEACARAGQPIAIGSAGFNEPSLMLLAPGAVPVRFLDGAAAADFLQEGGCRAVFVERRQEMRFVRRAEALGLRVDRGADIPGYDYNEGRRVRISLYRRAN